MFVVPDPREPVIVGLPDGDAHVSSGDQVRAQPLRTASDYEK